jgi:di-heme oxidoreductase (putative peroxidase)
VTGVATISGKEHEVKAYTDLLLHEMGSAPRTGEGDSRNEFRTSALWGVIATGPYLHDGSAATLEQAILPLKDLPSPLIPRRSEPLDFTVTDRDGCEASHVSAQSAANHPRPRFWASC